MRHCYLLSVLALAACSGRAPLVVLDGGALAPDGAMLVDARPAGCADNVDCAENEYCHIAGACAIGEAKVGECRARPVACQRDAPGACGCDGKTYPNACNANAAGVNVAHAGACAECGTLLYLPACAADEFCQLASCPAPTGECLKKPTECPLPPGVPPWVCGCDGRTYPTDCHRQQAGTSLNRAGKCDDGPVTIVTDKLTYASGETLKATLTNGKAVSIFLPGCTSFSFEREEKGSFANKGPKIACGWEGYALEVPPGASWVESTAEKIGGTYRLGMIYGTGCQPGKPLSDAACASSYSVHSNLFTVIPPVSDCLALESKYQAAMKIAKTCALVPPPPALPCQSKASVGLSCGCPTFVDDTTPLEPLQQTWGEMACSLAPLPVCDCAPDPASATCVNGTCVNK